MTEKDKQPKAVKDHGKSTLWKKGQSGNPAGRKAGTGIVGQLRKQLEQAAPEIVTQLIANAKAGDPLAIKLLVERVFPAPKSMYPQTDPVLAEQLQTPDGILQAAQEGELSSDHAGSFIDNLKRAEELRLLQEGKGHVAVIEVVASSNGSTSAHVRLRLPDEDRA